MPSQISLRTSPVQVGHNKSGHFAGEDDMKAAARTVGSLLVAHKAVRKPPPRNDVASVNFNGCGKSYDLLSKTNGTRDAPFAPVESNHRHLNGMVEPAPLLMAPPPCKTHGESSNENVMESSATTTDESNRDWLMCPDLAVGYTGGLIGKRINSLASKQRELERRVASLQRKVRFRQMNAIHSHTRRQLDFEPMEQASLSVGESSLGSFNTSDCSTDGRLLEGGGVWSLPIQVDGASDDTFLSPQQDLVRGREPCGSGGVSKGEHCWQDEEMQGIESLHQEELQGEEEKISGVERTRNQDSFSSLDSSYMSSVCSEGEERGARSVRAQLTALQGLLDGELTDSSSDEEGEESADHLDQHDLRTLWDDTRLAVGCRWVWLQRRIAELNKQIYRLDHRMKFFKQEKMEFASPAQSSPAKPVLPPYFSITNGSVLEHLRTAAVAAASSGGGGLIAMGKTGPTPTKPPSGNNGFTHHPHHPAAGHVHSLPQLLLPDALLGAKLQVKDLLSPSHGDRNILYVDDNSFTAARTRALLRRPNRRVVRKKAGVRLRGSSHHTVDAAFHPQLSMAHELPSRIPLDCALKQVLSEHSYAQLPPLRKRRKAVPSLPRLSTPLSHGPERSQSPSPSPIHTPHSLDSTREWSIHKKSSLESSVGSPWSPGLSRPLTPSYTTPLHSARKKRVTNSTPLFDIDNIVIPYSMAASTRLEKLEYKEIITPSWREVRGQSCGASADSAKQEEEGDSRRSPSVCSDTFIQPGAAGTEEDVSDQAYMARHNRCELIEKKRFLNFISGGQRKRSRPQSMTLSESGGMNGGNAVLSPPPRRLTIASPSPSHAEPDVVPNLVHVVVAPWQPRVFPLNDSEQSALVNPPPPPPLVTRPASPISHTPSQTPSRTSSALPTPVASPRSTPSEDTPAMSPAEWAVVNAHFPSPPAPPTTATLSNHCPLGSAADSALPASPFPHNPIILKLTKKTC